MTFERKLAICIAAMSAVVLGIAGAAWYSAEKLAGQLNEATSVNAARTAAAGNLRAETFALRESQRGMLVFALARDVKRVEKHRAEFREHLEAAKGALEEARRLSKSREGILLLKSIEGKIESYAACFDKTSQQVASGRVMAALILFRDTGSQIGAQMENAATDYVKHQNGQLAEAKAAGAAQVISARWTVGVLLLLGFAALGAIGVVVRRMTDRLRSITTSLAEGAAQIAAASGQVASSSQSLAQGASEQAASLEQTSASAEQITSMTRQNAANTANAAQLMHTVDDRVRESNQTLALMVESMRHINDSSGKISKIIKVIDEIAFQTNILALNAAVEAARAGEAGMGFAVVADEVRSLAQRSAQAAKDTTSLIEESISTSNEGSVRLQKVSSVVMAITEAAGKVKVLVDEVNVGSQEQAKGIEEIARFLTEMDKLTQGTAASSEESASASEEMSAQAQSLAHLVEDLRLMAGTAA